MVRWYSLDTRLRWKAFQALGAKIVYGERRRPSLDPARYRSRILPTQRERFLEIQIKKLEMSRLKRSESVLSLIAGRVELIQGSNPYCCEGSNERMKAEIHVPYQNQPAKSVHQSEQEVIR